MYCADAYRGQPDPISRAAWREESFSALFQWKVGCGMGLWATRLPREWLGPDI